MIVWKLFLRSFFEVFLSRRIRADCFLRLILCLEAKGNSSVISIRVEREREYGRLRCAFLDSFGKDNVSSLSLVGV